MLPDRTVGLYIRTDPKGGGAEGYLEVKPTDPRYKDLLQALGGLAPGEEKFLPVSVLDIMSR